jgi:hypothetical protein
MSRQSIGLEREASNLSERIVRVVTEDLTLNQIEHADRVVVLDSVFSTTCTIVLPKAIGSGARFTIFNNAVQTASVVVSLAVATDYMSGVAVMLEQAGGTDDQVFYTTATSDKVTLNATTTGGIRGDEMEFVDYRPGYYLVKARLFPSGDVVTPFSAT